MAWRNAIARTDSSETQGSSKCFKSFQHHGKLKPATATPLGDTEDASTQYCCFLVPKTQTPMDIQKVDPRFSTLILLLLESKGGSTFWIRPGVWEYVFWNQAPRILGTWTPSRILTTKSLYNKSIPNLGLRSIRSPPKYPNSRPLRALKGSSILNSSSFGGWDMLLYS